MLSNTQIKVLKYLSKSSTGRNLDEIKQYFSISDRNRLQDLLENDDMNKCVSSFRRNASAPAVYSINEYGQGFLDERNRNFWRIFLADFLSVTAILISGLTFFLTFF